ncbi:MAG: twin-arginine translocase TatA/TatE family subunit [Candidatus Omnitrophica bacterium]|nr:twin-arginine translocase TatA/TatE family subunit [Candidatus Omnitrophota bacterium]
MGRIGFLEVVVVMGVLLLIFGVGRLPKVAKSIAESIKEFRKGLSKDDQNKV